MQQAGWIVLAAVLVGPVLMGLLLHRLGFSRAVSIGLGATIVGAGLLVSREPLVNSSVGGRATAIQQTISEPPQATADDAAAALDREKSAHQETRLALKAAQDQLAASDAERHRIAAELAQAKSEVTSTKELEDARRRIVIAEATIARLEAATRTAPPQSASFPLPAVPAPFSSTPPPPTTVPEVAPSASMATGTTTPVEKPASDNASTLGLALSEAAKARKFELTRITDSQLVEGRQGSYYRITCSDGSAGNPLKFEAGGYELDGGEQALARCVKAIQQLILSPLPSAAKPRLYVQGFASTAGFVKSKRLPPRDARLRAITYLPRTSGKDRFAAKGKRRNVGSRFANAELPYLRAAYVADWIARSTKGALRAEILEGELKPGNHPSSRSFDLVLQAAW